MFTYSPEEDTSAYGIEDDIPQDIKDDRRDRIMMLQQEISYKLNEQRVGTVIKVLIDRKEGGNYIGRTEFDSPEVDNEVIIKASSDDIKIGNFYNVKVTESDFFDLIGEII